jgi:hypothetical protein
VTTSSVFTMGVLSEYGRPEAIFSCHQSRRLNGLDMIRGEKVTFGEV